MSEEKSLPGASAPGQEATASSIVCDDLASARMRRDELTDLLDRKCYLLL